MSSHQAEHGSADEQYADLGVSQSERLRDMAEQEAMADRPLASAFRPQAFEKRQETTVI